MVCLSALFGNLICFVSLHHTLCYVRFIEVSEDRTIVLTLQRITIPLKVNMILLVFTEY